MKHGGSAVQRCLTARRFLVSASGCRDVDAWSLHVFPVPACVSQLVSTMWLDGQKRVKQTKPTENCSKFSKMLQTRFVPIPRKTSRSLPKSSYLHSHIIKSNLRWEKRNPRVFIGQLTVTAKHIILHKHKHQGEVTARETLNAGC